MSLLEASIDPSAAAPRGVARIGDFLALTKPRVMSLVMFTAAVGFAVAPGRRDALTGGIALLCIAAGAGGAGALNMWHEADLDAAMIRTSGRPIPSGRVASRPRPAISCGRRAEPGRAASGPRRGQPPARS